MKIDSTEFGGITIHGTTYAHDVLIQLSGGKAKATGLFHISPDRH